MDNPAKKNIPQINFFYAMSLGTTLGLAVAVPLVLFLLLGIFLDKKFNTFPIFLIVLILLSLAVVGLEIKKMILPFLEKRSQKSNKNIN